MAFSFTLNPNKNRLPSRSKFIARLKKNGMGQLMSLPLIIGLAIFNVYPFFYGIVMSFFDVSTSSMKWTPVGLGNYTELFHDTVFLNSFTTMFIMLIPGVIISVFIPFIFAELIFNLKSKKASAIYRILFLIPAVTPSVITILIWKNLYSSTGLINQFLSWISNSDVKIDWIQSEGNPWFTYLAMIFMGFPWVTGTAVLIYQSGLMNINQEIYESAKLDGCGTFRRIFKIDMPLTIGQFRYFLIFGIIGGLQNYNNQLVLYKNTPTYMYVPSYYLYYSAYTKDRSGYASAIGVCLLVLIMILTLTANLLTKKDPTESK